MPTPAPIIKYSKYLGLSQRDYFEPTLYLFIGETFLKRHCPVQKMVKRDTLWRNSDTNTTKWSYPVALKYLLVYNFNNPEHFTVPFKIIKRALVTTLDIHKLYL